MPHEHVCPWWIGYLLANPLRRLVQKPEAIVGPFIRNGVRVLEVGPGMGFFTLPMARMVGANGKIIVVDIQERMLVELGKRSSKAGLGEQIERRLAKPDSLAIEDLSGTIDFALLMAVVHEIPDQKRLFEQIRSAMKASGKVLMAEPRGHVSRSAFDQTLTQSRQAGFGSDEGPAIWRCWSAILSRS